MGPAGVQLEIITLIKNCLLELLPFDCALPRRERERARPHKTHKTSSPAVRCGADGGAVPVPVPSRYWYEKQLVGALDSQARVAPLLPHSLSPS